MKNDKNASIDIENQNYFLDEIPSPSKYSSNKLIDKIEKQNNFDLTKLKSIKKSTSYPIETCNSLLFSSNTRTTNNIKSIKSIKSIELVEKNINTSQNIVNNDFNLEVQNNNDVGGDNNLKNCLVQNKTSLEYANGFFKKIYYCMGLNKINRYEFVNKLISVLLHIFIMIIFEIYFYFNYVVWIEKQSFLDEINSYIGQIGSYPLNLYQKELIKLAFVSNKDNEVFLNYLYNQYIQSLKEQKKLLAKLLIRACMMGGGVGLLLVFFLILGYVDRKKIKWNWIWIENLLMFLFLGIFEYLFFTNIIMNYSPITDAEIKYYVANEMYNYFNSTSST
jgi:hypothetical protein